MACSGGVSVYASPTNETLYYATQRGIELYQHHIDIDEVCIIANDIVLTTTQVTSLLNDEDIDSKLLKRANLTVKNRDKNGFAVDSSELSNTASENAHKVYFEYVDDVLEVEVAIEVYVVKAQEIFQKPEPTPNPNADTDKDKDKNKDTDKNSETDTPTVVIEEIIDDTPVNATKTAKSEAKNVITEQGKEKDISENFTIVSIEVEEQIVSLLEGVANPIGDKKDLKIELPRLELIMDFAVTHAYIGGFGLSIVLLVILALGIVWDLQALVKFKKEYAKMREIRQKMLEEEVNKI
jgi:hypothetical protein